MIVSQVKSNRVVYFTDDADYEPPLKGDWYYISHYTGELPEGMSLRNCWRWRFNGGVFTDAKTTKQKTAVERLVDNNRRALLKILQEKMNALRRPLLPKGTFGTLIRVKKLAQANAYLAQDIECTEMFLLQGVASSRGISMMEAAQLVIEKSADANRILEETEIEWERIAALIRNAKTENELLDLRAYLLDEVHPELSSKLAYKIPHTKPIDLNAPLSRVHRTHEVARLKAQLREHINSLRSGLVSDYIGEDDISRSTLELAKMYLDNEQQAVDCEQFPLLQSRADLLGASLKEVAESVEEKERQAEELRFQTELKKNKLLRRIETIQSIHDVQETSLAIKQLNGSNQ